MSGSVKKKLNSSSLGTHNQGTHNQETHNQGTHNQARQHGVRGSRDRRPKPINTSPRSQPINTPPSSTTCSVTSSIEAVSPDDDISAGGARPKVVNSKRHIQYSGYDGNPIPAMTFYNSQSPRQPCGGGSSSIKSSSRTITSSYDKKNNSCKSPINKANKNEKEGAKDTKKLSETSQSQVRSSSESICNLNPSTNYYKAKKDKVMNKTCHSLTTKANPPENGTLVKKESKQVQNNVGVIEQESQSNSTTHILNVYIKENIATSTGRI